VLVLADCCCCCVAGCMDGCMDGCASYISINRTEVVSLADVLNAELDAREFVSLRELEAIETTIEKFHAKRFFKGNRFLARQALLDKKKAKVAWEDVGVGVLTGLWLMSVPWVISTALSSAAPQDLAAMDSSRCVSCSCYSYIFIQTYIRVHTYLHTCNSIPYNITHIYIHTYVHIHTYIQTYIHTNIHTYRVYRSMCDRRTTTGSSKSRIIRTNV
jgi:hypothetical protein